MHNYNQRSRNVLLQNRGVPHPVPRHHTGHDHVPTGPVPPLLSFYFPVQNETSGDSAGNMTTHSQETNEKAQLVSEKGLPDLHLLHLPDNHISTDLYLL